jgi:hypothetical protein
MTRLDLGEIMQGERGTGTYTWIFPDNLTSPASILSAAITAVMRNIDTGAVTAVTGTLTGTAATTFTWARSAADSGTAGAFAVVFRAVVGGVDTYTLEAHLVVADNPAVDTVAGPALVGLPTDHAAWVAAGSAGGALGTAAYQAATAFEGALGNPATTGFLLSSTTGGTRSWITPPTATDRVAKAGDTMTGTLVLDPGIDDTANIFKIKVTDTDNSDFNFNISSAVFSGVTDIVCNWGFNNAVAGAADATEHAWYLQLENNYNFSSAVWAEYHLNLFPVGGTAFRPFQFQYKIDGSFGILSFRGTEFYFNSIDAADDSLTISGLGTVDKTIKLSGFLNLNPKLASGEGMKIVGGSSVTVFGLDTNSNQITWKGGITGWRDAANTTIMELNTTSKSLTVNGNFNVLMATATQYGIFVRPAVASTGDLISLRNSSNVIQFGVKSDGKILTNQTAANAATPSGATSKQLPIYDAAGTLLGYIPVYAAAWT